MSQYYFSKKSFEERKAETDQMKQKYPDRVFVYLEKQARSQLPSIDKHKFLVPKDLTIGQMMHVIRKRIKLDSTQSIFLFTENNTLPMTTQTVGNLYNQNANKDGFMYLTYNAEETYG